MGNYGGYSYDINDTSQWSVRLPVDYKAGTAITVHVRWTIDEIYGTISGKVRWRTNWSAVAADQTEQLDTPPASGILDTGDINIPTIKKTLTDTTTGTIAGGNLTPGDEIGIYLIRLALNDGNNPFADPIVTTVVLEYTSSAKG
jgi:hypothetical protein